MVALVCLPVEVGGYVGLIGGGRLRQGMRAVAYCRVD